MKISQKLISGILGIAALSVITEKHGGSLQCISSPGEGAEFIIAIPIREVKLAESSTCDRNTYR